MKKTLLCGIVLFLALTTALFANRLEIEEFINAFETYVVEAEKLAEQSSVAVSDLSALSEKSAAIEPKAEAVGKDLDWTVQDGERLTTLGERWSKALITIYQKLKY
jgi:hypothetical protein